jgi:uncharacterized protein YndB with AHSA1/START domain
MMVEKNSARTKATTTEQEVIIERIFDAPRELVFEMWTKPEHLARWWGPYGWTTTIKQIDVKPGGIWHYCMKSDTEDQEGCGKAIFSEVVPPERLVYTDYFADAEGNVLPGTPETVVTIEFADYQGKTKLTNRSRFASAEELKSTVAMGMVEGFAETWDRLEAYLVTVSS